MNIVTLIGRLTRDVELSYVPNTGTAKADFALAVPRDFKNKDGEKEVDFIPVEFMGKKAENIAKYIEKGSLVAVQGNLRIDRYTDKQDNKKTYTSYNISLWKYTIEIIIGIVFINSFFILSIIYLYVYFDSIKIIIKNEILINDRIKSLNNLIIGINLVLLYNDESLLGTNTTMRNLIDNINTVEGNFRQILSDISTKSNIYASLLSYDTKDPCSFFSGFNTYYNLITCDEYMTNNGLSFEISQIYNLINIMYDDYLEKGKHDNTSLKEQFNAPDLISLMINNIFFIRLYLNDLTATYSEEYLIQLNNTITIIYVKFIIYLIIIFTLIALFRLVLVKKILNMINNLNRVKVFFDETVFKS